MDLTHRAGWREKDSLSFKHNIPLQMHGNCQESVTPR